MAYSVLGAAISFSRMFTPVKLRTPVGWVLLLLLLCTFPKTPLAGIVWLGHQIALESLGLGSGSPSNIFFFFFNCLNKGHVNIFEKVLLLVNVLLPTPKGTSDFLSKPKSLHL